MSDLGAATLYGLTPLRDSYPLSDGTVAQLPGGQSRDERIAEAAAKWVGQTFFGILLSEMRRTVPEGGMFSGGRAEQIFRQMSDQQLAQTLAERTDLPITQGLIRQLGGAVAARKAYGGGGSSHGI